MTGQKPESKPEPQLPEKKPQPIVTELVYVVNCSHPDDGGFERVGNLVYLLSSARKDAIGQVPAVEIESIKAKTNDEDIGFLVTVVAKSEQDFRNGLRVYMKTAGAPYSAKGAYPIVNELIGAMFDKELSKKESKFYLFTGMLVLDRKRPLETILG